MKNIFTIATILFMFVHQFSVAQIEFSACGDLLQNTTGGADYTFTNVGTDATGRNIFQTTPFDGADSCPLGACELQISWNQSENRWELVADDLADTTEFNGTNLLYFNTAASTPNPPDTTLGTWEDATTNDTCGGDGFTVLTGDVQSTVTEVCTAPAPSFPLDFSDCGQKFEGINGATTSIVNDPAACSGAGCTGAVLEINGSTSDFNDAAFLNLKNYVDLSDPANNTITLDFYASRAGNMLFQMANPSDGGLNVEILSPVTVGLNSLELDFDNAVNAFPNAGLPIDLDKYSTVFIFVDFGEANIEATHYVDNIEGGKDGGFVDPNDCITPTNVSVTNITETTAELAWDAEATASSGYEWVVMNSGDAPAVDGSEAATGTVNSGVLTASASGLNPGASYDAYVRSDCGVGVLSDWSAVEGFTTPTSVLPQEVLVVDLSTPNQITITATTNPSAATVSGLDLIGFYFEDFFINTDLFALNVTTSGDLTSAQNTSDGTPNIFSYSFDPGLNIYVYTDDATSDFIAGLQAFSGEATWSVSESEYNAMLTAPSSGNIYAFADDLVDLPSASIVGTYTVVTAGNTLSFEENFSGVGLALGSIAFGDVDGDSDQDVISTGVVRIGSDGEPEGFNGLAQSLLFTNEGNNLFVADPSAPFNGVSYASSGLGDYNADGDLDFILTGENFRNGINPQTIDQFYLGDGFGNFAQDSRPVNFTNLSRKKIVAGNLDAEASFELLVIGVNSDGMPETKLLDQQLLNQQTILVESSVQSLPSVIEGSIDLGDVDGDGDLDVFISGELVNGTLISNIFLNDGNFQFSLAQNTTFTGVSKGAAKFVDIDSDGDVDLLISGKDSSQNNVFDIHLNDGTGSYTLLDLDGVLDLSSEILVDAIGLADTDGDTDQDLVVTGYNTTTFSTILKFFTNELVPSPDNSSARQLENFIIPEKSVADVKETIKLYPNPTNNGVFSILTPQLKGKATVSINNVMGRALIKKELNIVDASIKVNAQSLRQGVYIVTITQGKQTFNARLMVD